MEVYCFAAIAKIAHKFKPNNRDLFDFMINLFEVASLRRCLGGEPLPTSLPLFPAKVMRRRRSAPPRFSLLVLTPTGAVVRFQEDEMTTRDERNMSPQAAALLRAHRNIGHDRGIRDGQLIGFIKGMFTTLFVLWLLALIF